MSYCTHESGPEEKEMGLFKITAKSGLISSALERYGCGSVVIATETYLAQTRFELTGLKELKLNQKKRHHC